MNLETGVVKITDFDISSSITRLNDEIYNPEVMEGTLPYLSPEQTGRMNRSVDYRTDLNSLGEELAVILPETGDEGALEVVEKIRANIEALEVMYKDQKLEVTISIGVASYPIDTDAPAALIGIADHALYLAKHNGRNRVMRHSAII